MENTFQNQSSPEKLYNLGMIEYMCRGNREAILKMNGLFIEKIPEAMEIVKKALGEKDVATVRENIHRIKPVLYNYGIPGVAKDIAFIETLAEQENTSDRLAHPIHQLDELLKKVIIQLSSIS